MQSTTIRRAKVEDAKIAHKLLLLGRDDIPLTANFEREAYVGWVRDQCRKRNVWMLEHTGVPAGIMVMHLDEIFYLVTAPSHRKAGVAQSLVEDAKVRVWKKFRSPVCARVKIENTPVVRLLEKLGFVEDHIRDTQPGWTLYSAKPLDGA